MGALRIVSILVVIAFHGILSNVDCHMILRSCKDGAHLRSHSQATVERRDSPVLNVPKYFNRAEAKRVSVARWKNAQSLAAAPRPDNATVINVEIAHFSAM